MEEWICSVVRRVAEEEGTTKQSLLPVFLPFNYLTVI